MPAKGRPLPILRRPAAGHGRRNLGFGDASRRGRLSCGHILIAGIGSRNGPVVRERHPRPAAHSGQRNGGAERLGQREGPPYVVIVVCERDEMERRWADTAEERDRLVLELEQQFRDCQINVVPEG
jgi:hypothetical protein